MKTSSTPSPPNNPTPNNNNLPHPSYQHPFPHNNTNSHHPPPPPSSQPSPYPQQGGGGYGGNIPQHAFYPNGPSYNSNGQNGHSIGNGHHNGPNMPMANNHGGQQIGHPNDNINSSRKFMNNSTQHQQTSVSHNSHHSHHPQSITSSAPNNSHAVSSVYQTPTAGHVGISSNSHISSSNTQMSYSNNHMSSSNNHNMPSASNHTTLSSQSAPIPAPSQLPTSGNKQQLFQQQSQHHQHNGHNQQQTSHLQHPSQQKYHNNNNNNKMSVEPSNSGPSYRVPNFGLNGGHHPFAPSNYVQQPGSHQQHHSNSNAPTPTIVSSIGSSSTMSGGNNMQSKPVFTQANESALMKPTTSTSYPQSAYSKSAGLPSKPYPPSSLSAAVSIMAATHGGHILHPAHPTPPPYQPPPPTPSNLEINPPNPQPIIAQNSTAAPAVVAAPPVNREPIRYEGEDLNMVAHPDLCRRLIASKTELKKLSTENNNHVSELNKKIQVKYFLVVFLTLRTTNNYLTRICL